MGNSFLANDNNFGFCHLNVDLINVSDRAPRETISAGLSWADVTPILHVCCYCISVILQPKSFYVVGGAASHYKTMDKSIQNYCLFVCLLIKHFPLIELKDRPHKVQGASKKLILKDQANVIKMKILGIRYNFSWNIEGFNKT